MSAIWARQKKRKEANWSGRGGLEWGRRRRRRARPPIQDSMENQPHATRERNRDGTKEPRGPKVERARMGKVRPWRVPGKADRVRGRRRRRLEKETVAMPCHQDMPRSTREPAR